MHIRSWDYSWTDETASYGVRLLVHLRRAASTAIIGSLQMEKKRDGHCIVGFNGHNFILRTRHYSNKPPTEKQREIIPLTFVNQVTHFFPVDKFYPLLLISLPASTCLASALGTNVSCCQIPLPISSSSTSRKLNSSESSKNYLNISQQIIRLLIVLWH